MDQIFDTIIVGAGPVGAALAHYLGSFGYSVLLLEKNCSTPDASSQKDSRGFAIAPDVQKFLEHLHIWQDIKSYACPIKKIITQEENQKALTFDAQEINSSYLGHIIEAHYLRNRCRNALPPSVLLKGNITLQKIRQHPNYIEVDTTDGRFFGKLLIGADGKNSVVRTLSKITVKNYSYHQTALTFTVKHDHTHQYTAYEMFTKTRPLAILPMTENRSAIVYIGSNTYMTFLKENVEKYLYPEIKKFFPDSYGKIDIISPIWQYPLTATLANKYYGFRTALVGDAAHAIHPLAGQGLNLGLRDAMVMGKLIHTHKSLGLDIGFQNILQTYHRKRILPTYALVSLTTGLNTLFTKQHIPLKFLRNTGLSLVQKLPALKRFFIKKAIGQ